MKKTITGYFTLVIALSIIQGVTFGQSFKPKVDFQTPAGPFNVISADLNGDNIEDAATVNLNGNSFTVFINVTVPSDSAPRYTVGQTINTGNSPVNIVAADFNLDGLNDLAITASLGDAVYIYLNTTTIGDTSVSFVKQTELMTGSMPYGICSGDFNNDGKPDIAATNHSSNTVSVLFNSTNSGSSSVSFGSKTDLSAGNKPVAIIAGDFNGDYLEDLAVANQGDNTLSIILNKTVPGSTTPNFASKEDFLTGNGPNSVSAADLDNNGTLDFAVANKNGNSVSFFRNTTLPGSFTSNLSAKIDSSTGSTPSFVVLRDVNGDGKADALVTNGANATVSVFLNSAFPGSSGFNFSAQKSFSTGKAPNSIALTDINRDGRIDILTANFSGNSFSALYNDGFTYFQNISLSTKYDFPTQSNNTGIASGDLNGDGRPDFAVSNWDSSSVSVFINTTPFGAEIPSFAARRDFKVFNTGTDVQIADINNDGKPDLIVTNWSDSVSVLINRTTLGDTTAVFAKAVNFNTGFQAGPNAVAVGDLNSDGKLDLAVANQFPDVNNTSHVAILFNVTVAGDSVPNFTDYQAQITGDGPFDVTIADFNGDLKNDIAVANSTSGTVSVFLNSTSAGDTVAAFSSKTDLTAGLGTMALDAADLNGDGKIDIAVANQNDDEVAVLMNKTQTASSTLSFGTPLKYSSEAGPNSMLIEDFDLDGKPELLVTNGSVKNVFSVFFNGWALENFDPYFGDMTNYNTGALPVDLAVADINGDGLKDFAVANQGGKSMSVLLNFSVVVGVNDDFGGRPNSFELLQNYPNPFNPSTIINFKLKNAGNISLKVFDILGREVADLFDGFKPAGFYSVTFDASNLSSGVYFYRLKTDGKILTRKMMLLR